MNPKQQEYLTNRLRQGTRGAAKYLKEFATQNAPLPAYDQEWLNMAIIYFNNGDVSGYPDALTLAGHIASLIAQIPPEPLPVTMPKNVNF